MTILMSAENTTGWKLEDLLAQISKEVAAKTSKIASDYSPVAMRVAANNHQIIKRLLECEQFQCDSIDALSAVAPDPGPNGTPRIGSKQA